MQKILKRLSFALMAMFLMLTPAAGFVGAQGQDSANIRIWTVDEAGQPIYDVCYELDGYSNVGCDDNSDGTVEFKDIPFGEYQVNPSYPDDAAYGMAPFFITVDAVNTDFEAKVIPADPGNDKTDLYLITRDPDVGDPLPGACYSLSDIDGIFCDENYDGVVQFGNVPYGTYTVTQETAPSQQGSTSLAGSSEEYEAMAPYEITLDRYDKVGNGPVIIPLIQAESQGSETSTNMSVVVVDRTTGEPVADAGMCVQFPGMTEVGCDDDMVDGQIDFIGLDPTYGQPTFKIISMACGYTAPEPYAINMHHYGEHNVILVLELEPGGADCS